MGIGETDAFASQPVYIGSRDFAVYRVVNLYIAIAQVIGINDDNIGILVRLFLFLSATQRGQ